MIVQHNNIVVFAIFFSLQAGSAIFIPYFGLVALKGSTFHQTFCFVFSMFSLKYQNHSAQIYIYSLDSSTLSNTVFLFKISTFECASSNSYCENINLDKQNNALPITLHYIAYFTSKPTVKWRILLPIIR